MELVLADGTVFHAESFGAPIGVRGELGGQPRRLDLLSGASAESSPFRARFELRPILLHGLGFEVGQEKRGLARSPAHFRSYLRELRGFGLPITDYGTLEVSIGDEPVKVFSEEQLSAPRLVRVPPWLCQDPEAIGVRSARFELGGRSYRGRLHRRGVLFEISGRLCSVGRRTC
jgi:hypothetical protein